MRYTPNDYPKFESMSISFEKNIFFGGRPSEGGRVFRLNTKFLVSLNIFFVFLEISERFSQESMEEIKTFQMLLELN